jgi:hypothetical protein
VFSLGYGEDDDKDGDVLPLTLGQDNVIPALEAGRHPTSTPPLHVDVSVCVLTLSPVMLWQRWWACVWGARVVCWCVPSVGGTVVVVVGGVGWRWMA